MSDGMPTKMHRNMSKENETMQQKCVTKVTKKYYRTGFGGKASLL